MFDDEFSGGYMRYPNSYDYKPRNGLDDPEEYGIDIHEDDKHIYFTVELRGISDEDMNVETKERSIQLEIMSDGNWHKRNFRLPARVNPKKSKVSFNNCILDVILEKVNEEED